MMFGKFGDVVGVLFGFGSSGARGLLVANFKGGSLNMPWALDACVYSPERKVNWTQVCRRHQTPPRKHARLYQVQQIIWKIKLKFLMLFAWGVRMRWQPPPESSVSCARGYSMHMSYVYVCS